MAIARYMMVGTVITGIIRMVCHASSANPHTQYVLLLLQRYQPIWHVTQSEKTDLYLERLTIEISGPQWHG